MRCYEMGAGIFFRAWLVLSAVWIGLLVYYWEPKTYSWLWHAPLFKVETPSGHIMTLDTSKTHEELAAQVTEVVRAEYERNGRLAETLSSISENRDQILTKIDAEYKKAGEQAKTAWFSTLVPPILLLGLGLAVVWIFRGFRPSLRH